MSPLFIGYDSWWNWLSLRAKIAIWVVGAIGTTGSTILVIPPAYAIVWPYTFATKSFVLVQSSGIEHRIIGLQIYNTKSDLRKLKRDIEEWEEVKQSALDARAKAKAAERVNDLNAQRDELTDALNIFLQEYRKP